MNDFESKRVLVKYGDIMARYSISRSTAIKWAKDADAVYKIGGTSRIDLEKMDAYVMSYRG